MALTKPFQTSTAKIPTSTVELSVSCRNLRDADILSVSDPMCVLFMEEFGNDNWIEIGRTECLMNTLNPDFAQKFVLLYNFEENQRLRFEVYDIDSSSEDLLCHDFLGRMECTLGEIVRQRSITKPLVGVNRPRRYGMEELNLDGLILGYICVNSEEINTCREELTFLFKGINLDSKNRFLIWSSSSPFLTFSRANTNGTYTVVYRTEMVRNTVDPFWKPFTLPCSIFCNGDHERAIKVECYDWQKSGRHKFIGQFFTTLEKLKKGPYENAYELIHPRKQLRKAVYVNSGNIFLLNINCRQVYTFIDYLVGGTELVCTVGIDFTFSNGNPKSPTSLHFIDPNKPNQYVQALRAVGEILEDYNTKKLFSVLGFGAKLNPDDEVSHKFLVNMDSENAYCHGCEGVIRAYQNCLELVELYGPTNLAPIINHVSQVAQEKCDGSQYHIFLIITDGIVTDFAQTKKAIVEASYLPISIIIVGVGEYTFKAMEILEGKVVPLVADGKFAERRIVTLVRFYEFQEGLNDKKTFKMTQAKLARAVLSAIPQQFISWMKNHEIKPGQSNVEVGNSRTSF